MHPRLHGGARASANPAVPSAAPAVAPPPPRRWKPLTVFSVSPFEAERASRVFSPRRGARADGAELEAPTARSTSGATASAPATVEAAVEEDAFTVPGPPIEEATEAATQAPSTTPPAHTWPRFDSHADLLTFATSLQDDPLTSDGGRIVLHRGSPTAKLMVIGEGPGAEEDRLGLPFVGRSGQLLDRIFRFAGFDPEKDVYVTNVVKRRPADNRAPTAAEVRFYLGLLKEEIRIVDPALVVLAGRTAIDALLPGGGAISRMRGRWFDVDGCKAMPVYHPAYLLRNPDAKRLMKEDVLEIRRRYLEEVPDAELGEIRNQGSS